MKVCLIHTISSSHIQTIVSVMISFQTQFGTIILLKPSLSNIFRSKKLEIRQITARFSMRIVSADITWF